jgi:hypothetical protein
MASLARTTVFSEDSTRTGTGRYCSAVRDAIEADGDVKCMESESLRIEFGDADMGRSPIAKYPPSALSGSAIVIMVMW